jgi:hypothetical protein
MKAKFISVIKNNFKLLIYISLAFVIYALIKADYLYLPVIHNYFFLSLSLIFLCIGFFFQSLNWYYILKKDHPIRLKDAFISFGLYVFTKYIPGKVLVIVGKAGHIHKTYNYPLKAMITASLDAQLIVLWVGISVGSIGLFFAENTLVWWIPLIVGWIFLSFFIFTDLFHGIFNRIMGTLFKREFSFSSVSFKHALRILPVYFLYWMFFMAAFWFFSNALIEESISFAVIFGFPLAVTLGIITLIAPGGLGFREGILVAYLILLSIDLQDATTVSVSSRLWFMVGEVFMFLTALLLNTRNAKAEKQITGDSDQ